MLRADSRTRADRFVALGAGLVTVGFWASAFVGIRDAGHDLSPGALALARLAVGTAVLGVVLAAARVRLPGREELPRLVVCGVLWFGLYNVALNAGERHVDAGTAAMLVNVGPILIIILAGLLLGEALHRGLVAGCALAFSGVVLIAIADSRTGASTIGAALCLLAAIAYAGGVVSQKPALRRSAALPVTFVCCLVGTLLSLPFAPALVDEIGDARGSSLAWAAYLGAFPTALAFTTWAFALARSDAGRLGTMTYLVPPVSILMSWALLGETPTGLALVGGVLCLTGVVVARRA